MPPVNLTVHLLDTERLGVEDDIVFKLKVLVHGPIVLRTNDNEYRESLTCDVFVQEAECRSDNEDDLLRCATRRIEELAKEAHAGIAQETL